MIITNCLVIKATFENELALQDKNIVFSDLTSEWISTRYMVAYSNPAIIQVGITSAADTPKELDAYVGVSSINMALVRTRPIFNQSVAEWAEGYDGFKLEGNFK